MKYQLNPLNQRFNDLTKLRKLNISSTKFSIITIVYNGEALLQGTIDSVRAQTFSDYEYLIIDGKSKDATLDIIKANEDVIFFWMSEPDKGLYEAMNKGLAHAQGEFVFFLNCGDHFFDENTLAHIVNCIDENTDIVYGDVMYVNEAREHLGTRKKHTTHKLPKNLNTKSFKFGMSVSHQGIFVRRSITTNFIENNLAADIDWVIAAIEKSRKNVNAHIVVSEFLVGGISKQKHKQSLFDRYQVLKKHYGFIPNLFNHGVIVLRAVLKSLTK